MRSKRPSPKQKALATLKAESERKLDDQIRRLPAKPMNERTHLRKRIGLRGSAI